MKLTSTNCFLTQINPFHIYLSRPARLFCLVGFDSDSSLRLSIQSLVTISWIPLLWLEITIDLIILSVLELKRLLSIQIFLWFNLLSIIFIQVCHLIHLITNLGGWQRVNFYLGKVAFCRFVNQWLGLE